MNYLVNRATPLFALAVAPIILHAQTLFDRAYSIAGDTTSALYFNAALSETIDHEFYSAAGLTLENGPGTPVKFIWAQRTAADGAVVWHRKYTHAGGAGFGVNGTGGLSDGSLITCGLGQNPLAGLKAYYLRTDANGLPMAARWYSQGATGSWIERALEVNDSTILLCGGTQVGGFTTPWSGFADLDGDITSAWYVQHSGGYAKFDHVSTCPGGFVLAGGWDRIVNPDTTLWGLTVSRIDSAGNVLWVSTLEETSPSAWYYAKGVFAVPGGFRVFAESRKQGSQHSDVLMIALDEQGGIQWQTRYWFTWYSAGCPVNEVLDNGDGTYCIAGGYSFMGRASVVIDTSGTILTAWASGSAIGLGTLRAIRAADGTIVNQGQAINPNGAGDYVPKITRDQMVPNTCSPVALPYTTSVGDLQLYDTYTTGPLTFTVTDITADIITQLDVADAYNLCITTGQQEAEPAALLTVYPDPAADVVTITGVAIERVEITDATGRVVLARAFHGEGSVDLDLGSSRGGLYHVRIKTGEGWHCRKLVKEQVH